MIRLDLRTIADAVGGTLAGVGGKPEAVIVDGEAVIDSRLARPGGLFVALAGEHVDGHDYAGAAVALGAAAVLASRPVGVPAVVVDDVPHALGELARFVRPQLTGLSVIGLTGSSGKTTTKDLLAQVLPRLGPTVATAGSFNNELGLPLTLLRARPSTRYLVLEMGSRGKGHLDYLCGIAAPRIGVVLNVGSAHVGEFGGLEGVAAAKGELVECLPPDGLAVLNADDERVRAMSSRTAARISTFGSRASADVRAAAVRLDERGRAGFELLTPEGAAPARLQLFGEHQVGNALAAAAVARELGMPVGDIASALGEAVPLSRWRMEVNDRADGVTVMNDAYNANPESVRAALRTLVGVAGKRRTWAVLGEMRELGASSGEEHDAIGRLAVRLGIAKLVVVGEAAKPMHLGASLEGSWGEESMFVPDADAALALLRDGVEPGDVVLVKASRAVGLERVAEAVLADEPGGGAPRGADA